MDEERVRICSSTELWEPGGLGACGLTGDCPPLTASPDPLPLRRVIQRKRVLCLLFSPFFWFILFCPLPFQYGGLILFLSFLYFRTLILTSDMFVFCWEGYRFGHVYSVG